MSYRYSLFFSLVAAISGLLFGYHTSIISGALLFLSRDFVLTTFEEELVVSTILIGAVLGAFLGGLLADMIGRKKTLFVTIFLYCLGTLMLSDAMGFDTLLMGRFVTGLGLGIGSMAAPLYIAEVSPAKVRGALVSLNQLMITLGILLAYFIQFYYSEQKEWRQMFAFGLIPLSLQFLGLFFISETPSWLMKRHRPEAADKIYKKLGITPEHLEVEKTDWKDLFKPDVRKIFWIGMGISVFQQITGINTIIYYAPKIFQLSGDHTAQSAILATLYIGIVNVIFTIIALWLIDRLGRRLLLILGLIGMVVSLGFLGYSLMVGTLGNAALGAVMCYVAFFAISLGPVTWLLISEIYPLRIRGMAMGVASFLNWLCNYVVSLTFLSLLQTLGTSNTFWLYAAICLIALWFIWKMIPETKGKTLEQIQKFWQKGYYPASQIDDKKR